MNYSQDTTPGASDVPLQPARLPANRTRVIPVPECSRPNAFFSITPRCRHGFVFATLPRWKVVPKGVYERCGESGGGGGGGIALAPLVVWRGRRCESPFGKAIRRSTFTCLTFTCLHAVNKNPPCFSVDEPPRGRRRQSGGRRRWRGVNVKSGKVCFSRIRHAAGGGVLVRASHVHTDFSQL